MFRIILTYIIVLWSLSIQAQKSIAFHANGVFYDKNGKIVYEIPKGDEYIGEDISLGEDILINPTAFAIKKKLTGELYFINEFGKFINKVSTDYYSISIFRENKAIAYPCGVSYPKEVAVYINSRGEELFNGTKFKRAYYFSENLARVETLNGEYGYIDTTGNMVINISKMFQSDLEKASFVYPFINGFALIMTSFLNTNGELLHYNYYLIDKNGKITLDFQEKFKDLIFFKDRKDYNFQDKSNKNYTYSKLCEGFKVERTLSGLSSLVVLDTLKYLAYKAYVVDDRGKILAKKDWIGTSSYRNIFDYNYFVNSFSKYGNKNSKDTTKIIDLSGNLLITKTNRYIDRRYKNIAIFSDNSDDNLDSITIFNIPQRRIIIETTGNKAYMKGNFIFIDKNSKNSKQWLKISNNFTIYSENGERVYKSLDKDILYEFERMSEIVNLDYDKIYRATYNDKTKELIAYSKKLEELGYSIKTESRKDFPENIFTLKNLKKLTLNNYSEAYDIPFPKKFNGLKKVEELYLNGGRYKDLNEIISQLPNLKLISFRITKEIKYDNEYIAFLEKLKEKHPKIHIDIAKVIGY